VDKVATPPDRLSNPYEIYWDEANRGKVYLLDDSRDAPAHMLLKNGIFDVNTEDPEHVELAKSELKSLIDAVNVKLSTDDYTNVPEGKAWVHQMWSGSAIGAQWYLPEGVGAFALRPDRRRYVGAVRLREPGSERAAPLGSARSAPADRRPQRAGRERAPLPLPPRVVDRRELEGRARELPRVLPLPGRAPRLQQGGRRLARRLPPRGTSDLLEPDRPRPPVGARGGTVRHRTWHVAR
jgi:hypothetical protein